MRRLDVWSRQRPAATAALFAGLYLLAVSFTPRLFGILEPDSSGYIHFHAIRTAGYPLFLDLLEILGVPLSDIGSVQLPIFCLGLGYAVYCLCRSGIPLLVTGVFYLSLIANIFFNAFHFTVLTESLSFAALMILIGSFVRFAATRRGRDLAIAASAVGFMITLRPASLPLVVGLLIAAWLIPAAPDRANAGRRRAVRLLLILVPVALFSLAESAVYHARFDARHTLLPTHVFGKAAMISAMTNIDLAKWPKPVQGLMADIDRLYNPVGDYLKTVPNTMLWLERHTDYENYAYFQLLLKERRALAQKLGVSLDNVDAMIGTAAILNYPTAYLKLGAIYYAGMFSVAAPTDHVAGEPAPIYLPPDRFGRSDRLPIIHDAFMAFGAAFILASVWWLVRFGRALSSRGNADWRTSEIVSASFLLWVQGLHVLVALTALAEPRYLMFSYPLIVLALLLTMCSWFENRGSVDEDLR